MCPATSGRPTCTFCGCAVACGEVNLRVWVPVWPSRTGPEPTGSVGDAALGGIMSGSLRDAAAEPDQVPRLLEFRKAHPEVEISQCLGAWQAWWRRVAEEVTITRYRLCELLDKLDEQDW